MTAIDKVRPLVEAAMTGLDADLYDLEYTGATLRVTLDRPGGIDVDTLTEVNRRLSRALDADDPIPGAYTLEVSSPGLERNLRTATHWAGALGERVKVKTVPGVEGERRIDGTVAEVDPDGGRVTLTSLDGATTWVVDLGDIERARTHFEWGPTPKPGGKAARPKVATTHNEVTR